ncbi:hypothetical protein UlMin_021461 [Ulmus minor]
MSPCVPSWDFDDCPPSRLPLRSRSNSIAPDLSMEDYQVTELTWENGQISMHNLGPPRVLMKSSTMAANPQPSKFTWEKQRPSTGTLESIVNQATFRMPTKPQFEETGGAAIAGPSGEELVPWYEHHHRAATATAPAVSTTSTLDAQVPCTTAATAVAHCDPTIRVRDNLNVPGLGSGTCLIGSYTQVGSCSGATAQEENVLFPGNQTGVAPSVAVMPEWNNRGAEQSVSGSAPLERETQQLCLDSREIDFGVGCFASTSLGSPENASSGKPSTQVTATDDRDSVCHGRPLMGAGDDEEEEEKKKMTGKSSVSTKRSRAAATHNQSERKRRDKINQRMKTLQKLVPNSSKTDKASMLDEVIEYLKQLQAQIHMMGRMNIPMMLPVAMQQQLQMSMMSQMGMGMGMGMDINSLARSNLPAAAAAGISPVLHPIPFMPMPSLDGSGDRAMQPPMAPVMPDHLSPFFACQSQPMTMEAYKRMMATMYQQFHHHQHPPSSSKS